MRNHLVALTLLLPLLVRAGDWQVSKEVDSMTDREANVATTRNASGHSLTVYQLSNGQARMTFTLPPNATEVLTGDKWPMFRVDKEPSRDLDRLRSIRRFFPEAGKVEPKRVDILLWAGSRDRGRSDELIELMEGTSVVFCYYVLTGGSAETSFSLNGASEAIAQALNLTDALKSGVLQRLEIIAVAAKAARHICQRTPPRLSTPPDQERDVSICLTNVQTCQTQASRNPDQFDRCIKEYIAK